MDEPLYVVRLYDGFDNQWMDLTEPLSFREALLVWLSKTQNGTQKISYDEIDYYWIYPADTVMYFADGRGECIRDFASRE